MDKLKEYRQKIMTSLINDKELCELALDRTITNLDDADIQDELTKNHIYKFAFIPNMQEVVHSYIAFELTGEVSFANNLYNNMALDFYIFSHINLLNHSSGYLRTDLMTERVQFLIDDINLGVNTMVCKTDKPFRLGSTYYGRQLDFRVKELSKSICGK